MKRILWTLLIIMPLMGGCACSKVEQGYTGVIASLYGDEKGGVEEVGAGRHWYNPVNKDMYIFPNFVQRVAWTEGPEEGSPVDEAIRVLSRDQLEFTTDVGFSWYVSNSPGCSAEVFRLYRKPIEDITNGNLRDIVRKEIQDEFSQNDASGIYGEERPAVVTAIDAGIQARLDEMRSETDEPCFVIQDFALLRLDPPESVKLAVERKIQASQEAQQERENLMKVVYQSRQDSIRSAMDARNNLIIARSITPELLEWERLRLLNEKWDGKLPQVISGEGTSLMMGLGGN